MGAGVSCSGEGGSAQHLNREALCRSHEIRGCGHAATALGSTGAVDVFTLTRGEKYVETAKRVGDGRKGMERAAEMVAMDGDGR